MADYRFVSTWEIAVPIADVWAEVGDPLNWVNFWSGLERTDVIEAGDAGGVGTTYEFVFKSLLPYRLRLRATVTERRPCEHLRIETSGELVGVAVFDLSEVDGKTTSTLVWETRTTIAWMNAVAPLLRGLFEWNHDFLMKKAGAGLSRRLGAPVLHPKGSGPSLAVTLAPPLLIIASGSWAIGRLFRSRRS